MKHLLIVAIAFAWLSQNPVNSQTSFTYNSVGSMVKRATIILKSASTTSSNKEKEEFTDNSFDNKVVKIYPNPTKGALQIEIPADQGNGFTIQITVTELSGRIIVSQNAEPGLNNVDLLSSPNGIYILTLRRSDIVSQWKVIKQ
jgi:hypothetical protein